LTLSALNRYKGRVNDSQSQPVSAAEGLALLRTMVLTRAIEERLIRLYHQGKVYGGVYTGMGQEAPGAAACLAGGADDLYAPCIRNLSVHVGRGLSTADVFRQWLARAGSPTRGRDGNIHHGNLGNGVFAMISHLGAMLPVVVGGVMGRRRMGRPSVGFGFIGDGGSSTGDFHEAVNFSAVNEVPVVFVVESNHYAYSTPSALQFRCAHLVDRAAGYGIEGIAADGNDVLALYALFRRLAGELRETPRSVLVVVDTMRMRGHGEHDDFSYVPRELLDGYRARDPIDRCATDLLADGRMDDAGWNALREECRAEVDLAYRSVMTEPGPDPATLLEGVYESP
jgi:TPP-dependent pyruvate/acetoin dehydrogenase alpha subunit